MNKKPENMGDRGRADGDLLGEPPAGDGEAKRGPGRPPGALNRKTRDLERYLAATVKGYRDPAVVLAEVMAKSDAEIKADIACSLAEARALRMKAASELMPYLHGKMPVREDDDDARLPVLILDLGTDQLTELRAGRLGEGDQVMRIGAPEPAETAENSHSEASEDSQSHGEGSHETAKPLKPQG